MQVSLQQKAYRNLAQNSPWHQEIKRANKARPPDPFSWSLGRCQQTTLTSAAQPTVLCAHTAPRDSAQTRAACTKHCWDLDLTPHSQAQRRRQRVHSSVRGTHGVTQTILHLQWATRCISTPVIYFPAPSPSLLITVTAGEFLAFQRMALLTKQENRRRWQAALHEEKLPEMFSFPAWHCW